VALELHQWTAALYLVAAVVAALGVALPSRRASRLAVGALGAGLALHSVAFLRLHALDPPPSLRDLPVVVSLMAWIGTAFFLALLLRVRGTGLVLLVAPLSFAGAFFASLGAAATHAAGPEASPLWSHIHILLASAGFAMLGVAGAAGVLYVAHHRAIKSKRPGPLRVPLPPLEALDRVNVLALALGFVLLTLGLLSGVAWVEAVEHRLWPGGWHANVTGLAWVLYAGLVAARFGAGQGARQSALASAAGFAFLVFAVLGVGIFA
jgi:ABC-type uncharacterized transport system permease subunit